MKALRFGLIGAGAIARSYLDAFAQTPDVTLVGIADLEHERARALSEGTSARAHADYRLMLAESALDAVIICVPPNMHAQIAIDALAAGVHVLCEKPLTLGAFTAKRMIGAAQDAGRLLTMASKFRFVDDLNEARRLIASGAIGVPLRIENTFMAPADMRSRWNANPAISGGGVLIDNGTHSVDIMRFLMGSLVRVHAVDTSAGERYPWCEDSVALFVRNTGGTLGVIELSWSQPSGTDAYVHIVGTNGQISVAWQNSRHRLDGARNFSSYGTGYKKVAAFRAQLENFACAIRGEGELAVSLLDALASVEAIDAAYTSMNHNVWTTIVRSSFESAEAHATFA